jgi:hypothetical protein
LIDGVDEIARRQEVKEWVENLAATFPQARFIVTSRPLAQSDAWETPKGFVEAELLPMEPADILLLIDHWHDAVRAELQPEDAKEMDTLRDKLRETIDKNHSIRSLASVPLLCAMICALHRDKHRQLPANRLDLYEACTSMLIEERERHREIQIDQYPSLDYREKIALLADLAYYLLTNGWSEVPRARAKERLSQSLRLLKDASRDGSPAKVLDYFVERTGMVREPVQGIIDFAHRTFQEYLAARKAIDNDDVGVLIKNARDAQWREVIVLAAGLCNSRQRQELFDNLILLGDCEPADRYWYHLLAVACLETVTDVAPDIRKSLRERVADLIPPRSMTEVAALASAGDLAVPHLAYQKGVPSPLSIRTLEMICSPMSVQTLIGYVSEANAQPLVLESLRRLSLDDAGRQILNELSLAEMTLTGGAVGLVEYLNGVGRLTIKGYQGTDLEALRHLTAVRELVITGCPHLVDVSSLADLRTLEKLILRDCPALLDLDPISSLGHLDELELDRLKTPSITGIAQLEHLSGLCLRRLPITDLRALYKMQQLRRLELRNCSEIRDVDGLRLLTSLKTLVLESCLQIVDLSSLKGNKRMEKIDVIRRPGEIWPLKEDRTLAAKWVIRPVKEL